MSRSKIVVNMVSESEISVQGHGVHTAYVEMSEALAGRPEVELIRGEFGRATQCDIVHLHTIGPRTWRKLFQRGPKKVISVHVVPQSLVGSIRGAQYYLPLARWYMRWFYGRADKVLAVSGMVAETLGSELKIPKDKIETVYNTIDMSKYTPSIESRQKARGQLGLGDDEFLVIGNGQVQPRKRLDTFVFMAKSLPDVKFIWVGGIPFGQLGASYGDMQRMLTNLPANMTVTGVIKHAEVAKYLAAADVFCLPAEQENHPMCVLEAAGSGLPIILRDIPEYDETFVDDVLRCGTDEQFVQAVKKLRASPEFEAKQKALTAKIAERFDSATMAGRLVDLYREILN